MSSRVIYNSGTRWLYVVSLSILFFSCSTTKRVGDGAILYTGVKKIEIITPEGVKLDSDTKSAIKSLVNIPPNNPLLSPYLRSPLPTGLWAYNMEMRDAGWFKRFIFKRFARRPILISDVTPDLRRSMMEMAARNRGHFGAKGSYEIIPHRGDSSKAKIVYRIDVPDSYKIGGIELWGWPDRLDTIVQHISQQSKIGLGDQYSVEKMVEERERISSLLRNSGYYYFAPDYIEFQADSTHSEGRVIDLRIALREGAPEMALHPYKVRQVNLSLGERSRDYQRDTLYQEGISIDYEKPLLLRKRAAVRAITLRPGDVYTVWKQSRTHSNLARLGIFKFTNMELTPTDTLLHNGYGLLDVNITAEFDHSVETDIEVDMAYKSNSMIGPGLSISATHKNLLRGGEDLTFKLIGSYEWQTQSDNTGTSGIINSYEIGFNVGLTIPEMVVPNRWKNSKYYNEQTQFRLSADLLNRSGFFRMLSFSGSTTYDFQSSANRSHSITPFKLNYTYMLSKTEKFDSTLANKEALRRSFEDQFIPTMSYSYYYNSQPQGKENNRLFWQATITQAGNIISGLYLLGGREGEDKKIFGNPYSQFLKFYSQIIWYKSIGINSYLATRVQGGVGYAYGNRKVMPYSEQFFVGGANSIRGFTIRTLGPGRFKPKEADNYSYMDQVGDIKFELNAEYRVLIGDGNLNGAIFLDAGNIWLLRKDPKRPNGELEWGKVIKDLALGTGFGLRYDIGFLVLRGDVGIGLHNPSTLNGKYFNSTAFKDWTFHLAIGYPF